MDIGTHAAERPTHPALVNAATGAVQTFGDLEARSNRLAHYFHAQGLRRGDHVALFMENTMQFLEIAWAADPVALFFLQIQGSGRLRFADGTVMRIGYAGQNGWDYTGIGSLMKQRGLLGPGQTSMQGIVAWLHEHPDEGQAIMRENRSYVFFRELTGPGPLGPGVGRLTRPPLMFTTATVRPIFSAVGSLGSTWVTTVPPASTRKCATVRSVSSLVTAPWR